MRYYFVKLRLLVLLLGLIPLSLISQVAAPSIRCVEVEDNGDVTITWQPPVNNFGQFREYEIYSSTNLTGPYTLLGTIPVWGTNFYTHAGAGVPGGGQLYYYIITRYDDGSLQSSSPSDTVSPMILSLTKFSPDLSGMLNWNAIHDPRFPTNNQDFEIYRRFRYNGNQWQPWAQISLEDYLIRNYTDSASICDGAVAYKIELPDRLGCQSRSNIEADTLYDLNPPEAPVIDSVSIDNDNGTVLIGWTPSSSPDVTGYIITRGQFPNSTIIDTVNGKEKTSYIDNESGLDYFSSPLFYQVTAVDSCGNTRPAPAEHSTINLQTDKDLCSREILLSWNNYDGWPSVQRYTIFVREDAGPYRLLADLDGNTRTFAHEGIDATKIYCYIIVGRSSGTPGTYVSTSNLVCVSFPALEAPSFEYIRSVDVIADDTIEVTAYLDTSVSEDAVEYYLLRRSYDRDGPFVTLDTLRLDSSVYELIYRDTGVSANQFQYAYVVDAIDNCDQVIKRSNVGRSIHLTARGDKYDYQNELNWSPYVEWLEFGSGVQQYDVYLGLNNEFGGPPIGSVGPTSFRFFDALNLEVEFASTFCYYVEAVEQEPNLFGLRDTSRSNVVCVSYDPDVYIPDVFTPNKDSRNEFWKPVMPYINPADYRCDIYDRWGNLVFVIDENNYAGFPGETSGGSPYPVGVYIYHLRATAESGSLVERKGSFYLLR